MAMTETEIRQLSNDRDYWRRKCEAMERKYAKLLGRSFLAFAVDKKNAGDVWGLEAIFVEDARDGVRAANMLHDAERTLLADVERRRKHG